MRYVTVVVAILIVFAGCASLGTDTNETGATGTTGVVPNETGTDQRPTTSGTTSTNGETSTSNVTDGEQIAPGITEGGIQNASALLDAHQRAVLEDGYVGRTVVEEKYTGTLANRNTQQFEVGADGERVSLAQSVVDFANPGGNSTTDAWINATTTSTRRTVNGTTEYASQARNFPRSATAWMSVGLSEQLTRYADDFEFVGFEDRNGTRVANLTASVNDTANTGAESVGFTLIVAESGVVRNLELRVEYQNSTWTANYEVLQVGGVSPERPAWVGNASMEG